jgi:hypothetical protein
VSPLWRDEIAIHLSPRKLALVRHARGLRPRAVDTTELPVPAGPAADFRPVLARLADVLAEPGWQRAAARVVVADQPWARYGVVPWPDARLDEAGRLTHARYLLADVYGEAVAGWEVSLADTPPGRSTVACAIPGELRSALQDTLASARVSLVSLRPQLVVAFETWRRRLPGDDAWFVRVDEASLSAVHLARGAWDRVHTARLAQDWGVELERLQALGRLTRAAGAPARPSKRSGRAEGGRMLVDAPAWMRRGAAAVPGIEWLEEGADDPAQPHELALLRRMYA